MDNRYEGEGAAQVSAADQRARAVENMTREVEHQALKREGLRLGLADRRVLSRYGVEQDLAETAHRLDRLHTLRREMERTDMTGVQTVEFLALCRDLGYST